MRRYSGKIVQLRHPDGTEEETYLLASWTQDFPDNSVTTCFTVSGPRSLMSSDGYSVLDYDTREVIL